MPLAKGCVRDAPHKRTQKSALEHPQIARLYTLPASASLESFEAAIEDQGQTSSCTGHGTSQGLWTAFAAAGQPLPWVPSPGGIYKLARAVARVPNANGSLPELTDDGAMPSDVMSAISTWGIRAMQGPTLDGRSSDVTPGNVNDQENLAQLQQDGARIVTGEYRIEETSPTVVEQVCTAIAAGIPVGVSFFCDGAFENWTAGQAPIGVPNMDDSSGGGHWVVLTSFWTAPGGVRVVRGPNSWGPGWGDRGHFEANENWLRSAWDLYPLAVARAA
jgi:hypothetical protein